MKNIDVTLQYLKWALIAAEAEANPDCREVVIHLDLSRRQATTSFIATDAPQEQDVRSELLRAVEVVHTALTGPDKFNRDGCIALLAKASLFARQRGVRVPRMTNLPQ